MTYSKEDIKKVLDYFNLDYEDSGENFILPTYCHHQEGGGHKKLYIYFKH